MDKKILVILGPTASGKSDLAIKLAKIYKGEIISADSRQVYQNMDLGTGKVKKDRKNNNKEYFSNNIRHHLLDVFKPTDIFTVSDFQKKANVAISDILKRKKLPIICGGTGFYISALTEGWQFPQVKPNYKLRKKLEKLTTIKLYQKLIKKDPARAKNIDRFNRVRLIRALEISEKIKKTEPLKKILPDWNILFLGVKRNQSELKKLIKKRLDNRLSSGMISEIKKLKKQGVSSKRLESFGLEYRWINRYLENKIDNKTMQIELYRAICQYAKRQMTWFKKMQKITWVKTEKQAEKHITKWLKTN